MREIHWRTQLWHRWKTYRNVPFRRKWFVGYDLEGNSYWEFRDHNNPGRLRRIVEQYTPNMHFSDYKGPPQWVQWLRHVRPSPPSLQELLADQARQARIRILAAEADKRWKLGSRVQAEPRLDDHVSSFRASDPRKSANLEPTTRMSEKVRSAEEQIKEKERVDAEIKRAKSAKSAQAPKAPESASKAATTPVDGHEKSEPAPKKVSPTDDRTVASFQPTRRG